MFILMGLTQERRETTKVKPTGGKKELSVRVQGQFRFCGAWAHGISRAFWEKELQVRYGNEYLVWDATS